MINRYRKVIREKKMTPILLAISVLILAMLSCSNVRINRFFGIWDGANTLNYFLSGMDEDAVSEGAEHVFNSDTDDQYPPISDSESSSDVGTDPSSGKIVSWWCRDVAGEISAQKSLSEATTYGIKGTKLISTKLEMQIRGGSGGKLDISFNLNIEREDAIIDAETETITGYITTAWTKTGSTAVGVSENGVFSDTMEVLVVQDLSGATTGSYESTESHAFFGLIQPDNLSVAYICDRSAQQIPEGLENLTPENFLSYCLPGYYYECDRE